MNSGHMRRLAEWIAWLWVPGDACSGPRVGSVSLPESRFSARTASLKTSRGPGGFSHSSFLKMRNAKSECEAIMGSRRHH